MGSRARRGRGPAGAPQPWRPPRSGRRGSSSGDRAARAADPGCRATRSDRSAARYRDRAARSARTRDPRRDGTPRPRRRSRRHAAISRPGCGVNPAGCDRGEASRRRPAPVLSSARRGACHERSRPGHPARSTHADRLRTGRCRRRLTKAAGSRSGSAAEPTRRSCVPTVSMRQLLEAGVHFGHQTRRWNPKMRPYIFAERNGIHIIDLAQTVRRLDLALDAVRDTVAAGDSILFVGTKKQAQEPVSQEAIRAGQPYVTKRWLGGMMTNFVTIKKRVGLLEQLEARQNAGDFDRLPKKEAALLTEELNKLQATLGGIRRMKRLPGAMFVVDPHRERIAVTEANKLEIPVIGTGDTNVDPDELDYIIPANDDAIRAIRLLCQLVADAAIEGGQERQARSTAEPEVEVPIEEPEFDEGATDEIVARLAAGEALSFAPDLEEDELLPGAPGVKPRVEPEASPEEIAAELAREQAEREAAAS